MKKGILPSIKLNRNRTTRSKVTRVPKNDVLCDNKENQVPEFVPAPVGTMKKIVQLSKTKDRDVKASPKNPYDVPENIRLFSSPAKPSKTKPEPFIMGDIRTIVDVDPSFYEIIEGRPVRQFIDVKQYMREIRGITTFRTDAAFAKDRILAIEDRQYNELQEYSRIVKSYEITKRSFVKCIKQSYAQAKAMQVRAEQTALDLANMADQLEAASFDYVRLRNLLANMGANFDTLIYYAKVLNSVAPPWWRQRFDNVNHLDAMSYIYVEKLMDTRAHQKTPSMSTLDGYEITVIKYKGTPHLFLKSPEQLINKFECFGEQCLNYMKIDAQTSVLRNYLIRSLAAMRAQFDVIVADIEDYVELYTEKIKFFEDREEAYRKAFFKLVMGEFHDLFASYDNTKLFTCIQYVNTQVFKNPEDPNDSMVTLMSQLESYYLETTLKMDSLDQEVVKTATTISYSRDIKEMNEAFKAKRVLKEFDILNKTLYTSFEPPRARTRPEIKWGEMKKKNKKTSKAKSRTT